MSAKAAFPRALWALAAVILLIGRSAAAQFLDQTPEQKFQIDPAHLAKPYASDSVDNSPDIVARPDVPFFRLPPGFAVNEFAGGFKYPRWLAVAPNGDVFLTLPLSGEVVLLRDADGDGRAELTSTFAAGFERPHGLAFHDGYLYVADVNRVWRLACRQAIPRRGLRPNR
jgi:glucose/arabinose dehydrogenase